MSVFNEANMIAVIKQFLPQDQNLKAGIHAVAKEVKLHRLFSNTSYDPSCSLIQPFTGSSLFYMSKSKMSTFDVYMGFSEDYIVMVPCEKELWYYEHAKITDPQLIAKYESEAIAVKSPIYESDILPVYRISQIEKCQIKKNWVGAYVCKIDFNNGDFIKVLLPPFAGLFGGMPNHKSYRNAILELLKTKMV